MNITNDVRSYSAPSILQNTSEAATDFRFADALSDTVNGRKTLHKENAWVLDEMMKSGNCIISMLDDNGNKIFSVNLASKGDKELSVADLAMLREKYGKDGLTTKNHLALLEDLTKMGVISGMQAHGMAHDLASQNTSMYKDIEELFRQWVEHYRMQSIDAEGWLQRAANDRNADISMASSLRGSVEFNGKMSRIIQEIYS